MNDAERTIHAITNLRSRLDDNNGLNPRKKIAYLLVKSSTKTTKKSYRFFIVENNKIEDITGLLARAIGDKWNDRTGTLSVNGGNGSDAIALLSIRIYNSSTAIEYYGL